MASFDLGRRFDVVVCAFDSINHLLDFAEWESTFAAVARPPDRGGLFVFDVNTLGELLHIAEEQPWVFDFDGNVLIMDVRFGAEGRVQLGPPRLRADRSFDLRAPPRDHR